MVKAEDDGSVIYAYEVDGLGNALRDYDDANVHSLNSNPLLGWRGYDRNMYRNTRRRILSRRNKFHCEGKAVSEIGSTHTSKGMVWPMALIVQALTVAGNSDGNDGKDEEEILTKLR